MARPLVEILAEIPDFGKAKGKLHPLSAILAMACVAIGTSRNDPAEED